MRPQRRVWCQEWLQRRERMGSSVTILHGLQEENETLFRNYVRMDINSFYALVSKVESYIQRQETNMRQGITPAARVEATLAYLATGCCYTSLQYSTRRISKQSLSIIIPETYETLKDDYMKVPTTPEVWMCVAQGFFTRWNFPNCLGAIDRKHISIRPPQDSGSYFFNYSHYLSYDVRELRPPVLTTTSSRCLL
ncbi:uncharacterized protein LOC143025007 [Oratosquilla oratoria]|uniref:uncharacterized protein LOC143025007 n=1 Tax=Oratosquilla oratoria TaxID=337810 RepID=UPI003F771EAE